MPPIGKTTKSLLQGNKNIIKKKNEIKKFNDRPTISKDDILNVKLKPFNKDNLQNKKVDIFDSLIFELSKHKKFQNNKI